MNYRYYEEDMSMDTERDRALAFSRHLREAVSSLLAAHSAASMSVLAGDFGRSDELGLLDADRWIIAAAKDLEEHAVPVADHVEALWKAEG